MERISYPSITNFTDGKAKFLDTLDGAPAFVVTEKIHGANCSFITNGTDVIMASRNAILKPTDKFHDHIRLIEEHRVRILAMAHALGNNMIQLTVFGEVFGGIYPHAAVTQHSSVRHVQKGVFYAPDIHVRFFDAHIVQHDGTHRYLPWNLFEALCHTHGLPTVPVLIRAASMEACLAAVQGNLETLETCIPQELKLPRLDQLANIAEGVVIRPVEERVLRNRTRAMLKLKSHAFKEVHTDVGKHADDLMEEGADSWTSIAVAYVTENRLRNVMSKATTAYESMGVVMTLGPSFATDAYKDFKGDHVEFLALPNARQREVEKVLTGTCFELLRRHADAIMKGTF